MIRVSDFHRKSFYGINLNHSANIGYMWASFVDWRIRFGLKQYCNFIIKLTDTKCSNVLVVYVRLDARYNIF